MKTKLLSPETKAYYSAENSYSCAPVNINVVLEEKGYRET